MLDATIVREANASKSCLRVFMARVANESANWWVRTVIIGFASIVVAMVGWTLVHIMATADDNARKIVGIETRLGNIEDSIRDLKQ